MCLSEFVGHFVRIVRRQETITGYAMFFWIICFLEEYELELSDQGFISCTRLFSEKLTLSDRNVKIIVVFAL
jgi:hypothetical protein